MKKSFTHKILFLGLILSISVPDSFGQLSITSTGTAFIQNFDGMGSSATATLPTGFKIGTDWSAGTTVTGAAYGTTGTGVVTGSSGGNTVNWANGVTASATDRSLGFLNSGSFTSPKSIVLKVTNNTGVTISSFAISFDYEKSRSGSRQFDWTFFHGNTVTPSTSATGGDQSYAADANNTTVFNPPTTTSKSFTISGLSIPNGTDYYFKWTFTGLAGSTNGQGIGIDNFSITASAAITNPLVNLSVSSNSGTETAATAITVTATASQPVSGNQTVSLGVSGTNITAGDYTLSNATITILSGATTGTSTFTIVDDPLVEGTETAILTISNPSAGITLGSTVTQNITITDNDVPTVSVTAGNNAAEPSTNGTFNITLSDPAPLGGVTINYTLSGSATLNTDYSDPQSGSITIPQNSTTGTITLTVNDDPNYEGTETINILLNSASNGYAIAAATATINLLDNDPLPPIVINEVYGGGGNSGATFKNDFIELYNPTASAVNLTGWSVQYAAAAGTSWQKTDLTGSIPSHGYYLIQEAAGAGGTTNLPTPDASGSIAMSATAGKVALVSNSVALSGACPVIGIVDLAGYGVTANCFEGAGPTPAPSNTTSVQRNPKGFDSQNNNTDFIVLSLPTPKNSVVDILPPVIVSLFPADNATGVMTSFIATITFNENVLKGTGSVTLKKVSDNSIVRTIDVTTADVTTSGTTASFGINSLAFNTAYYFEISAGAFKDGDDNDFAGLSGATAWNFMTAATPPAGILGSTYNFNTCSGNLPGGFTQFSILGPQIWGCTSFGRDAANPPSGSAPNGLQINGFSGVNIPNEDWLISPSFDLTGTSFPLLSFWSRTAFTGATLQLKVSTDYTGTGDPNLATWSDINGKFPAQVSDIWKLSENINLSGFKSPNTYFAFIYNSTTEDGARWTLDDITVTNSLVPPPPSLTTSVTDIQYTFVANGASADKTFTFIGNDLTGGVTLTSTGAFQLSKDGATFSPVITYTLAEANNISKTVYVRFAPPAANQNFTGLITVNTPGVVTNTINLKGSSIDPATTLEVVNWNMEWFGSTTLGPTNDDLQEQNAATVLRTIGADIYGVVEVVSETRLQHVVANLNATYGAGTYNYIICNYGSHVNPPEPGGQPLSEVQKEAFIYKPSLFSNITTRPMINLGTTTASYNNWSGGRYPFLMTADVTLNCVTKKINFVLIHAKANTAPVLTAYDRREAAAKELHDTLTAFFANDNIIILGDFNDDLDQSITTGKTTTSYHDFMDDPANFFSPTLALSLAGKKSTVSYNDVIDHVMLSNDFQPYYIPGSANILTDVAALIPKYGTTTTDHYPVFTRYIFPNTTAPVVTSCTASVTYCSVAAGTYSIPAFIATDDCNDPITYSYVISGATVRTGSSGNASGSFNTGTSYINWTAADSWGNSVTCQTTVVINPSPSVIIPDAFALPSGVLPNTVYIGYLPASSITLSAVASGGTPGYSYSWSSGSLISSTTVSPVVPTTYTVTVTDANGCHADLGKTVDVIDIRGGNKMDKVVICHNNNNTLVVAGNAVNAHLAHGDMLSSCQQQASKTTSGTGSVEETAAAKFVVKVLPNPSASYFTINISSNTQEKISMKVTDIFGRTVEYHQYLQTDQSFNFGNHYPAGIYFAEISQGKEKTTLKLIKL